MSQIARSSLMTCVLLIGFVASTAAPAAEIFPLVQERYLLETTYTEASGSSQTETSAPDFGHFEVDTRHISDILPLELSGELNAYGSAWVDPYEGEGTHRDVSYYRVEFFLFDSTNFTLTGEIEGRDDGRYSLGTAGLQLSIFDTGLNDYQPVFDFYSYGDYYLISISEMGVLAPGQYQLEVIATGGGMNHSYDGPISGSGYASFALVIPEPATATLLGVGLLLLAARCRRVGDGGVA